jgi:hypothetical protein
MADLGDVVELTVDLPARNLRAGTRGAVVHCHADGACEVEITNDEGETLDLLALQEDQFIVVWSAATRQAVPLGERLAALLEALPEASRLEVLDFALYLAVRRQQGVSSVS